LVRVVHITENNSRDIESRSSCCENIFVLLSDVSQREAWPLSEVESFPNSTGAPGSAVKKNSVIRTAGRWLRRQAPVVSAASDRTTEPRPAPACKTSRLSSRCSFTAAVDPTTFPAAGLVRGVVKWIGRKLTRLTVSRSREA